VLTCWIWHLVSVHALRTQEAIASSALVGIRRDVEAGDVEFERRNREREDQDGSMLRVAGCCPGFEHLLWCPLWVAVLDGDVVMSWMSVRNPSRSVVED
jgi:hypothetical protein